jgi:hypothetical protein
MTGNYEVLLRQRGLRVQYMEMKTGFLESLDRWTGKDVWLNRLLLQHHVLGTTSPPRPLAKQHGGVGECDLFHRLHQSRKPMIPREELEQSPFPSSNGLF